MFGSDFFGNFGIPQFPLQGMDPQGGMLGVNAPVQTPMSQNDAQPAAGAAAAAPAQPSTASPLGASSPLAPGMGVPPSAASPGAIHTSDNTIEQTAPAAGIGSQFGKPNG